jgi:hypothetical protein
MFIFDQFEENSEDANNEKNSFVNSIYTKGGFIRLIYRYNNKQSLITQGKIQLLWKLLHSFQDQYGVFEDITYCYSQFLGIICCIFSNKLAKMLQNLQSDLLSFNSKLSGDNGAVEFFINVNDFF